MGRSTGDMTSWPGRALRLAQHARDGGVEPPQVERLGYDRARRLRPSLGRLAGHEHCADGRVGGRLERVRLIGLNTPQSVDRRRAVECFGREASARANELLLAGPQVLLEPDPSQGDRDRYGRLLRYVILTDGRNVAEVMIAEGYGFEFTYWFPYRYQSEFKAAEREARQRQRGLWAPRRCQ
jgi:endonuclease YncB( thermonuclease family)